MIQVRLRDLLEARGKSRNWLSQASGIEYKTLMRIERAESSNRIELRVLDALCRTLECQPGDLLVFLDEETSANASTQKGTRKGK